MNLHLDFMAAPTIKPTHAGQDQTGISTVAPLNPDGLEVALPWDRQTLLPCPSIQQAPHVSGNRPLEILYEALTVSESSLER